MQSVAAVEIVSIASIVKLGIFKVVYRTSFRMADNAVAVEGEDGCTGVV